MKRNKIFWLTGLSSAGKTTIAKALSKKISAEVLDGDDIRKLFKNKDFSIEGRTQNMLAIAELAHRLSKYVTVIVAMVSPIKEVREQIKQKYPNVTEIWVKCDLEECIRRDPKGLYKKAINGQIKDFTGISAKYEEPEVRRIPGIKKTTFIDTTTLNVEQCVDIILSREYKGW